MVGAATTGGGPGGDLRAVGQRSRLPAGRRIQIRGKQEGGRDQERKRLFKIIEDLVLWENTTNEDVLERARAEIRRSWREVCELNKDHPQAAELFNPDKLPAFHDPFAGGGAIPLEAQRLGLEAYAIDLNPVAVLINKAMIEIPPKFAGRPPVSPLHSRRCNEQELTWTGSGPVPPVWRRTCATTALGCARRRRSASATSIRRWKSPRRWRRNGPT